MHCKPIFKVNKWIVILFFLTALAYRGSAQLTSSVSSLDIGKVDSRTTQIRIPIFNQSAEKLSFSVYGGNGNALASIPKSISSYQQDFFTISPTTINSNKRFSFNLTIESKTEKAVVRVTGKLVGPGGNQECYDFEKDQAKVRTSVKSVPKIQQTKVVRMYDQKDKDRLFTSDPDKVPYAHLVALVDASGSMGGHEKLTAIKEQLKALVGEMRPRDCISVIRYSEDSDLVLDKISCAEKELIYHAIDSIEAGGFTNGEKGIETAMDLSRNYQNTGFSNNILMFTDGAFNLGEAQEGIRRYLLGQKRVFAYRFSILTIGSDSENNKEMKELTETGGGYYFNLDESEIQTTTLNKLLLKQLST